VILLGRGGVVEELPTLPKREVADAILDRLVTIVAMRDSR
jgi:hypothetical protein